MDNWKIEEEALSHLFTRYYNIDDTPIPDENHIEKSSEIHILVRLEDYTSSNKSLLAKILSAIGKNIDHCTVDMVTSDEATTPDHDTLPKTMAVLTFGINLTHNPIRYQLNKHEQLQLISADSLSEISASQDKKRLLWTALKQLQF